MRSFPTLKMPGFWIFMSPISYGSDAGSQKKKKSKLLATWKGNFPSPNLPGLGFFGKLPSAFRFGWFLLEKWHRIFSFFLTPGS